MSDWHQIWNYNYCKHINPNEPQTVAKPPAISSLLFLRVPCTVLLGFSKRDSSHVRTLSASDTTTQFKFKTYKYRIGYWWHPRRASGPWGEFGEAWLFFTHCLSFSPGRVRLQVRRNCTSELCSPWVEDGPVVKRVSPLPRWLRSREQPDRYSAGLRAGAHSLR